MIAPATPGLDLAWVRAQFPSLQLREDDTPVVYFDNPAGTQVPQSCIAGITHYLTTANANSHGPFLTSRRTDVMVDTARAGMAALLGAAGPHEIAFGPNMTTITFALSRALGRRFAPGDEVIVTELDHDANITPWTALEERGVVIRRVPVCLDDGTLDLEAYAALLSPRTRLVAVGLASNAVGTITDVAAMARMAHAVGAWVWVDAVHYTPHGPLDVSALGVDFLVGSAYKFFGPHLGILWGRADLLDAIRPYHVRPAPQHSPDKFEPGTKNHECLAGLVGTLTYLAALGEQAAGTADAAPSDPPTLTRAAILSALTAIRDYERALSAALLDGFATVPGLRVYGITDPARLAERVPTFAVTLEGTPTPALGQALGAAGIFAWTGNYYALDLMERLGLEERGGALRIGAVHYNTPDDVDRLIATLARIARARR